MDHLNQETMEAAGYFFLEIAFVPRSWVEIQTQPFNFEPDDYRSPNPVWWRNQVIQFGIRSFCDQRWIRSAPTGYYLRDDLFETSWSDENNHKVEIIEDKEGHIVEFWAAVDIRNPYSEFVDLVIEMSQQARCVFFDYENETIVEPSRQHIVTAIQHHEMQNVVFGSDGMLKPN